MPTATYTFVRAAPVAGFGSRNRASTDALQALIIWRDSRPGRGYEVRVDEDDRLIADLTWDENDSAAGPDLDRQCNRSGVDRKYGAVS